MTAIETHPAGDGHDHHDHDPNLAHHWDSLEQQYEAGKLGMWLFLATEFLLFGGLFCFYAVLRFNQPELFAYGAQFLDTQLGFINTMVLILSSMTMAFAVLTAQRGKAGPTVILLALTFLGGAGFMGIKYIEYSHKFHENIVWGERFYVPPAHPEGHGGEAHAAAGDDAATESHTEAAVEPPAADAAADATTMAVAAVVDGFEVPKSSVVPSATGPSGLAEKKDESHHSEADEETRIYNRANDPNRPANAHLFFGLYFCMTGLHGFHVLAGMIVIAWLAVKAAKGQFGPTYYTPVDLGGLYWHVVDLIWIFLFPLLYLIH